MARYTISNQLAGSPQNLGTGFKTITAALAAASSPRRGRVYYLSAFADSTTVSANNNILVQLTRQSANDGTGTAATPSPVNTADAAYTGTAKVNYTAEPTNATILHNDACNQLITYQWQAADLDDMFIYPATANNGFAWQCAGQSGGYASTVRTMVKVEEI